MFTLAEAPWLRQAGLWVPLGSRHLRGQVVQEGDQEHALSVSVGRREPGQLSKSGVVV